MSPIAMSTDQVEELESKLEVRERVVDAVEAAVGQARQGGRVQRILVFGTAHMSQ